ncbi:hypothetical protein HCG51_10860 [Tolypothrix sp. PCC 7910]|uniref:hypothetical protein n=1 Tax=Tolypothrix sp. PCC 7910 TaxID=2099387 RepID=UPI001427866F|nr:hypothetical protein [Tolypothrix sp. PCC 7910]QIR37172.1 hypothetical protein HCG51_10860 [Tolypothrix sp. PCC 7910]
MMDSFGTEISSIDFLRQMPTRSLLALRSVRSYFHRNRLNDSLLNFQLAEWVGVMAFLTAGSSILRVLILLKNKLETLAGQV